MNKEEHNLNEDSQSPLLSKLQGDHGFRVPQNYFDSLPAEVMKKIESLPDFESTAKEQPFEVPAGYFESLPTVIQQRIIDGKAKKNSVAGWIGRIFSRPAPAYALTLASVLILLVFNIRYFTRTEKVEYVQENTAVLPDSFFLAELDEDALAGLYEEEELSTDLEEDGMENYLLENGFDLNSITEHL